MLVRKKIKILIMLTILLFTTIIHSHSLLYSSGEAAAVIVKAEGKTKDIALRNCFREAVDKTVGVYIDNHILTKNGLLIYDLIYQNSEGYVSGYNILSEENTGSIYTVTANVYVNDKIHKDVVNMYSDITVVSPGENSFVDMSLKELGFKNIRYSAEENYGLVLKIDLFPSKVIYTKDYGGWYHAYKPLNMSFINNGNIIASVKSTGIEEGISKDIAENLAYEAGITDTLKKIKPQILKYVSSNGTKYAVQINNFSMQKLHTLFTENNISNIKILKNINNTCTAEIMYPGTREELMILLNGEYKNGLIIIN